jgi:transcriptional regulator
MSVHAKGINRLLDDTTLADVLRMTSLYFENQNHQSAIIFDNLPSE